jgi:hypothetical protein
VPGPYACLAPIGLWLASHPLVSASPKRQSRSQICVLPPDALHRLKPNFQHIKHTSNTSAYQDPNPFEQAAQARHLAKHVFPRAFGLYSVFSPPPEIPGSYNPFKYPEWVNRDLEIKTKGTCRTPRRLVQAVELMERMLWYHGKCGYVPLRDKTCPSKVDACFSHNYDLTLKSYSGQDEAGRAD